LTGRFLAEAARELSLKRVPEVHQEALAFLQAHPFRGNIRELRHMIKGAVVRAQARSVTKKHLEVLAIPRAAATPAGSGPAAAPTRGR
jgi:DNA-binding NtrC family response regulator